MTAHPKAASFDPAGAGWSEVAVSPFEQQLGPVWRGPPGTELFGLLVEPRHANRSGFMHGGAVAALFDSALGLASLDAIDGRTQATISLDAQFLAPIPLGAFLVCEPRVVRKTRSLVFMHGLMRVGDEPVAMAQGCWKILRA